MAAVLSCIVSQPASKLKRVSLVTVIALLFAILFRTEAISHVNSLDFSGTELEGMKKVGEVVWGGFIALLLGLVLLPALRRLQDEGLRFWAAVGFVSLVASMIMRGHHGGYLNVLLPGLYALAILTTLAMHSISKMNGLQFKLSFLLFGLKPANIIIAGLALTQLWQEKWDVEKITPTDADVEAGDRMIARLSKLRGPIFAPHSPWYPVKAGHPPTLHLIALWDIDHPTGPLKEGVETIKADIANHRFHAVVVGANRRDEMKRRDKLGFGVKKYYERRISMRSKGKALLPKTGWRVRPVYIRSQLSKKGLKQ